MKPAKEQRLPIALVLALILGGLSYLHSSASFRSSSLGGGMRGISTLADSSQRGAKGQSSRIYIEHADLLSYDASLQPGVQRLKGGVIFRHGNARMTCDSAYINEQAQTFEAFGEVHMVQGDTVNMYARYLYYDGITRLAKLRYNVHLANKTTDLYTDSLDYDRVADVAYYFEGGSITDAENTLTSDYGQFLPATNDAEFRYNVKLVGQRTTLTTQHLYYNTGTQIGSYEGPTLIQSDSGRIESRRGVYDVRRDVGILLDRSTVFSGAKSLTGDSIYYDGVGKFGEAFGRMHLTDTVQRAQLFGEYGYFDDKRSYAFATLRAHAEEYSQKDMLYVAADTLELISVPIHNRWQLDSVKRLRAAGEKADTMQRYLRAYRGVRIYRRDAQAVADSMSYVAKDSILSLYGRPIMWSEQRQLLGDTTVFYFRGRKLDYVDVLGSVLAVEHIDSVDYYNQMQGERLRAYLQDSTIRQLDVFGSVESIFYMKEDKGPDYTGLNRMTSAAMQLTLDSGRIKKSLWTGPVEGKAYPLSMAGSAEVNRLKSFVWASDRRPLSRESIVQPIGGDSLQKPGSTLAELQRFSGARAALTAYAPFELQAKEDSLRSDSIARHLAGLSPEEWRQLYQYVLSPSKDDAHPHQRPIIDTSWVYKVSSSREGHDSSSTSSSIGIPVGRNSRSGSRASDRSLSLREN